MSSISGISSTSNYYQYQNVFLKNKSKTSTENPFQSALDSLVSSGTITQDQETAISKVLSPSDDTTSSSSTSTSTSTSTSSSDNPLKSALDSLVSNGTITQDQEDSIAQAIQPPPPPPQQSSASSESTSTSSSDDNPLKAALDSLVSAGTITQDQEDTIAGALAPPDKPDMSSLSSSFDYTSYDSDNTDDPFQTALDALVSDGTITQDQETAISQAIAPPSTNETVDLGAMYSSLYGGIFSYSA